MDTLVWPSHLRRCLSHKVLRLDLSSHSRSTTPQTVFVHEGGDHLSDEVALILTQLRNIEKCWKQMKV